MDPKIKEEKGKQGEIKAKKEKGKGTEIDAIFKGTKKIKKEKKTNEISKKRKEVKKEMREETKERKVTEDGFKIYTEEELKLNGKGGGTDLCPFDCDCCF